MPTVNMRLFAKCISIPTKAGAARERNAHCRQLYITIGLPDFSS